MKQKLRLFSLLLLAALIPISCGTGQMGPGMMRYDGTTGGHYGYGGWIMSGLVLLAVVAVVLLWPKLNRRGGGAESETHETPLDTLKKRYARGEMDRETFDRMKKEINT